MKSKQDLKSFFENGDKPNQEQFWALIESYFHKDEPISLEELSLLKANLATIDKTSNGTETLGNVDTKEQVNAKINFAINALKANAPETYDTLKEIADYIANDSNAEAALLQLINTKLDKPTMTNNYYGLWDDTNKKFVNGNLRTSEDKEWIGLNVTDERKRIKGFQVESLNTPEYYNFFIGEDANLSNCYLLNLRKKPTVQGEIPFVENTFYALGHDAQMLTEKFDGTSSKVCSFAVKYLAHTDTMLCQIISSNDIVFEEKSSGTGQVYASYRSANGYWEFYKPIKGANIKDGLKLTPPASITPQPNMLIPKTDGSGLMWYDNNSIPNNIIQYRTATDKYYGRWNSNTNSFENGSLYHDNTSGYLSIKDRFRFYDPNGNALNRYTDLYNDDGWFTIRGEDRYGDYQLVKIGYSSIVFDNSMASRRAVLDFSRCNYSTFNFPDRTGTVIVDDGSVDKERIFVIDDGLLQPTNMTYNGKFHIGSQYFGDANLNIDGSLCLRKIRLKEEEGDYVPQISISLTTDKKGLLTNYSYFDYDLEDFIEEEKEIAYKRDRFTLKPYTKAERNSLANKEIGEMIWQTDSGNSGIRVYDGTNWLALQTTID